MTDFLVGKALSGAIGEILREGGCRCAVAFWGKDALKKLSPSSKRLKLICNLRTGGTNPFEIEKLPRKNIRQNDTLHAKVYLGRTRAVVSSANVSSNGLGLEGIEQAHWIEAGVALDDISEVSRWFEALWTRSEPISDDDLIRAKRLWRERQRHRPPVASLKDFDPDNAEVPLLYWVRDSDWDYNEETLRRQFGTYNHRTKKLIDNSLEVERGDRRAMRPGTWIVVWNQRQNGMPSRRTPSWFFTGRLIKKSFCYKGEGTYRDSVLKADIQPPAPFDLKAPQVLDAFLHTLSEKKFTRLRAESNNGQFYTQKQLSLIRDFWKACRDRYMGSC